MDLGRAIIMRKSILFHSNLISRSPLCSSSVFFLFLFIHNTNFRRLWTMGSVRAAWGSQPGPLSINALELLGRMYPVLIDSTIAIATKVVSTILRTRPHNWIAA